MLQRTLFFLLCVNCAIAASTKFIGGAFYWNGTSGGPCAYGNETSSLDDVAYCSSYPYQWGFGGEAQFQLGGSWWKGLSALSVSRVHHRDQEHFSFAGIDRYSDNQLVTYNYRLIAGGRLHPPQSSTHPLVPFIGVGGSLNAKVSKERALMVIDDEIRMDETHSESSKIEPGVYAECGFLGRFVTGALVSLTARVHMVDFAYEDGVTDTEYGGFVMLGYAHPLR